MPYRRRGKRVEVKKGGKWVVKSTCKSVDAAKKQIKLLRAVEHGWKPSGSRG